MPSFAKKLSRYYKLNFAPKIYEILAHGYSFGMFRKDCTAGLTLAIISIPLAFAFAIASGVEPANGIYTAIVAGFFIAICGGSKYQIGGPTGAFVVIILNIIAQFGYNGLLMVMLLSGILLVVAGFLKLGEYIKYIPYPVIVGFTSGIAVLLFSTQFKDLLGFDIANIPAEIFPKWQSYASNLDTINPLAAIISLLSFVVIIFLKTKFPKSPAYLVALIIGIIVVTLLSLNIDTIGSRFGEVPNFLPKPYFPPFDYTLVIKVLPSALTLALLIAVESLLSATVGDAMSGDNHNSNAELIGEGIANIACAFLSGIPATGAIARTSTNVQSGAQSPISGVMQSVFLLMFLVFLSPLAKYIPLSCLAAILIVVAYNMFDFPKFFSLLRGQLGDRVTLIVTFLLTVFVDLNAAIAVGFIMSSIIFTHRISGEVCGERLVKYEGKGSDISKNMHDRGVMSVRLSGPLFFGGASKISSFLKSIDRTPRILILRMGNVPMIDISGVNVLLGFIKKIKKHDTRVILSNLKPQPYRMLSEALDEARLSHNVHYATNFPTAVKAANKMLKEIEEDEGVCFCQFLGE